MDLENLSDVEIRQRLTALGQNVGPVTATTRTLHLKKLRTLMAMEGDAAFSQPTLLPTMGNGSTPNHHLDIEKEPPEQDEEPLTQLRVKEVMSETPHMGTTTQTAPVRASSQVTYDSDSGSGSDGEMCGHESVRYLSPEEMETDYIGSVSGSPVTQPSNLKKVLLAVSVLLLVVFVFFLSDRVHRQTANYGVDDEL
ncbi:hypothetical protein RB195_006389 [Necator americanus]|uniref:LEM domain-containing protein n=1 Tax=Necator americanus TaxID=51031 RepID=A0ABR1BSE8_NECAM